MGAWTYMSFWGFLYLCWVKWAYYHGCVLSRPNRPDGSIIVPPLPSLKILLILTFNYYFLDEWSNASYSALTFVKNYPDGSYRIVIILVGVTTIIVTLARVIQDGDD